jgi:hypothetical protein
MRIVLLGSGLKPKGFAGMIRTCPNKKERRGFLGISIAGTVFVVTDILFDAAIAALVAAATAAFFGWFWYALPLLRRART